MLVGAAVYVTALAALNYVGLTTLWYSTTREPAILSGIAVLVAIFSLAGLFTPQISLAATAVALSFLLLGQSVYFGAETYSGFGTAYWVCGAAALVMSLGGLFTFSGYELRTGHRAALSPYDDPPPGWYADPAGESRLRYWSGVEWTAQTRM
jgi:hypothetical protein